MNENQLRQREEERVAAKEAAERSYAKTYLNCAPGFWETYRGRVGSLRRRALVALFERFPTAQLPVNNKWQAKSTDPDLALLMKRGILVQVRPGAGRQHPMNKTSRKRQTYLVLASQVAGAM